MPPRVWTGPWLESQQPELVDDLAAPAVVQALASAQAETDEAVAAAVDVDYCLTAGHAAVQDLESVPAETLAVASAAAVDNPLAADLDGVQVLASAPADAD